MTPLPPITTIRLADAAYPRLLKEISDPPDPLYIMGALPEPSDVAIAVVGTRKAGREGLLLAKRFGNELAKAGAVVVSGLALGVDGAAHEGAVAADGRTIAVLAGGLDSVYPAVHENLARAILKKGGGLVSQYEPGTPTFPNQFLERNRIISGLCVATIVIEAPIPSGALATAKFALEQGRELFVTPGPADHPNYRGSHMLLRNGARLVSNAGEILEDLEYIIGNYRLTPLSPIKKKIPANLDNAIDIAIVNALRDSFEPLTVDKLAENTNLEIHTVNQRLTFLTLNGVIEESSGRFGLKQ